ncbi:MAG: hypothetical protein FWC68_03815 [Oscillospiraceae bacterium]|nr:hypothetical protein [Oscillospiraceae bacterium]
MSHLGGALQIRFLRGNSEIPTDNSNIRIAQDEWTVPARFGNLTGIWIEIRPVDNRETLNMLDLINDTTRNEIRVVAELPEED